MCREEAGAHPFHAIAAAGASPAYQGAWVHQPESDSLTVVDYELIRETVVRGAGLRSQALA